MSRPPLPPFTEQSAVHKVRLAEDGWNSRDPEKVALAYAVDSRWRNRSEFVNGRQEIIAFLARKWAKELDYRLIKELWAFTTDRIAVRFAYEWHDDSGNWYRSYGTKTGSSMKMASCGCGSRPLTIVSSMNLTASTVGRLAGVRRPPRIERLRSLTTGGTCCVNLWARPQVVALAK
jgi:nuclear transport factor 2 (NTF2) superfamily protein